MIRHDLKAWVEPYSAMERGEKTHEVRKNDRNFKVGDVLDLREFICNPCCGGRGFLWTGDFTTSGAPITEPCACPSPHGRYTGRMSSWRVTFITAGGEFGLPPDVCVMSVKRLPDETSIYTPEDLAMATRKA